MCGQRNVVGWVVVGCGEGGQVNSFATVHIIVLTSKCFRRGEVRGYVEDYALVPFHITFPTAMHFSIERVCVPCVCVCTHVYYKHTRRKRAECGKCAQARAYFLRQLYKICEPCARCLCDPSCSCTHTHTFVGWRKMFFRCQRTPCRRRRCARTMGANPATAGGVLFQLNSQQLPCVGVCAVCVCYQRPALRKTIIHILWLYETFGGYHIYYIQ